MKFTTPWSEFSIIKSTDDFNLKMIVSKDVQFDVDLK